MVQDSWTCVIKPLNNVYIFFFHKNQHVIQTWSLANYCEIEFNSVRGNFSNECLSISRNPKLCLAVTVMCKRFKSVCHGQPLHNTGTTRVATHEAPCIDEDHSSDLFILWKLYVMDRFTEGSQLFKMSPGTDYFISSWFVYFDIVLSFSSKW